MEYCFNQTERRYKMNIPPFTPPIEKIPVQYKKDFPTEREIMERIRKKKEGEVATEDEAFTPDLKILGFERITLDDVIGQESAKEEARKYITMLDNRKLCRMYGLRIPNMLFHGPAGTGKTLLAQAIAYETIQKTVRVAFLSMNLQDISSHYVNKTAKQFQQTIEYIQKMLKMPENTPDFCVLFMDEFDSMGKTRGIGFGKEDDKLVNALNAYLDGDRRADNISYIAATNFYSLIDFAQRSRFGVHVEFNSFKTKEEIKELFKVHEKRAIGKSKFGDDLFGEIDYNPIIEKMIGKIITGREVRDIVDRVVEHKLYEVIERTPKDQLADYKIEQNHFEYVVEKFSKEREAKKKAIGF